MRSIHMADSMLTFNLYHIHKIFRVGDFIQFYPTIRIDYFDLSIQEEPYLEHIIYEIYKFRFRPIAKYCNNVHKQCYHYLIEIFPDFKLFCFNWTKPYQSYLKVGQWYEGYGQLRNCGNAAQYNEYIPSLMMDSIFRTGRLTGIYENSLAKDSLYEDFLAGDYRTYEGYLDGFGYSTNFDQFKINVSGYKYQDITLDFIDIFRPYSYIIFCVDIIDKSDIILCVDNKDVS